MAYTQAQLDGLDAAIASGTLRVSYEGKTVEYRSMDELLRARNIVAAAIAPGRRPSHVNPIFDRGV